MILQLLYICPSDIIGYKMLELDVPFVTYQCSLLQGSFILDAANFYFDLLQEVNSFNIYGCAISKFLRTLSSTAAVIRTGYILLSIRTPPSTLSSGSEHFMYYHQFLNGLLRNTNSNLAQ
ncbi:hypothetical protein L1987_48141 [Smallanthus sonchifolius]|uniref:Uncharacterized protein n=1 Tax=Smallanthus sonchifolius TaxID=185202 RepID=A0ACB9FS20_9ASTR|nr:hypothetical protein L1987_48141 [Smallanthus sonchifolius]